MNKTCTKHPKYDGRKKPKTQCEKCLMIYFSLKSNVRKPSAPPSKVFRDKSKYTRKVKHRNDSTSS